jgi:hypothetical protein
VAHATTLSRHKLPLTWSAEGPSTRRAGTLQPLWLAIGATGLLGALAVGLAAHAGVAQGTTERSPGAAAFADTLEPKAPGADLATVRPAAAPNEGVLVPQSSISLASGKPLVFVIEPSLRLFVATPVVLGDHLGADQRVTGGLSAGQRVVTGDLSALETRTP